MAILSLLEHIRISDKNRLGYTDSAEAYAIDVSDGVIYVTGGGKDHATSIQGIFVMALSANDGKHIWSRIINPDNNKYKDRGYSVKADGKGSLYIAGWQGANTGSPFLQSSVSTSALPSWFRSYIKAIPLSAGSFHTPSVMCFSKL